MHRFHEMKESGTNYYHADFQKQAGSELSSGFNQTGFVCQSGNQECCKALEGLGSMCMDEKVHWKKKKVHWR